MNKVLVTGSSGFIGFHLSKRLLEEGYEVYGIDNMNSYYDIQLKQKRLKILRKYEHFNFELIDISNYSILEPIFLKNCFTFVFHLAAQAGVRYSFKNPQAYIESNIQGFVNLLECCRNTDMKKIFYASSSSVYGNCSDKYFSEKSETLPISLYGLTKKMNEDIAKNYYDSFDINTIGLRFFTVYGPWGRPDMAYYKFINKIINGKSIKVYNNGNHSRSFTYIDDVIKVISLLLIEYKNKNDFNEVYNIGGGVSIALNDFIKIIEQICNKSSKKKFIEIQTGDVKHTSADCTKIFNKIKFKPNTKIEEGLKIFYDWYINYI